MVTGQSSIRGFQLVDRADEVEMLNMTGENASESWRGEIVEPMSEGNHEKQKMEVLVRVALDCVQEDRDARPTMTQVVERLLDTSQ
ncbi:hypothetical protein like AT5G10290 [Hibiscus trionum]|uniref:Uncharacterized protein n=1 Tax=Hibiscus trionum TaxID=183268 RepID=A0A9W7IWD2_HIBTR|nr:hypothetical protein like AT5G10290 [Hibiscus trionum]